MRLVLLLVAAASVVVVLAPPARGQDAASGLAAAGTPAPREIRPAVGVPPPAAKAGDAGLIGEPPAVAAAWDRGLDALVRGHLDLATSALGEVAAGSTNDARRATARDLLDRIQRMRAASGASPGLNSSAGSAPAQGDAGSNPAEGGAGPVVSGEPNHEGRLATLGLTSLLGLAVYGWTVPVILGLDGSGRSFLGTYMLTAGASFGIPYFVTRERTVTWPMFGLGFWGGTRGLAHGAMLATLIAPSSSNSKGLAASLLLGSTSELLAGLVWAAQGDLTPGAAHTIGVSGDVGLLFGLGLAHVTDLDQRHRAEPDRNRDTGMRALMGMGLVGGAAGVAGGWWLSGIRDRSFGDTEVTRAAGVVGAWTAATVAVLANVDDTRVAVGGLMLGGVAGLVAGNHLVRDTRFGFGQSVIVDLATLAGGLVGAGVAYLITSDLNDSKPYMVAGTLGAGCGFALTYLTQVDSARAQRVHGTEDASAVPRVSLIPTLGHDGRRGLAVGGTF